MNNKHVALLLMAMCVLGTLALAQKLNQSLTEAKTAKEDATIAHQQAINTFNVRKSQVDTLRQETTGLRDFLKAWESKLKETDDENKAAMAFDRVMKRSGQGLLKKNSKSTMHDIKDNKFITKRYQTVVAMEGDYVPALTLLASLEKDMPASRVSAYTISKGSRNDEVKFSFTLDTPVLAPPADPAATK
jgi:Tfp pilus assembly protein PilV